MNSSTDKQLSDLFMVLSDATRLRIVRLIANGEVSVGSLAFSLNESQPKVSRHLAFMREHGVVSTRRAGKNIFYALDRENAANSAILNAVTGATVDIPKENRLGEGYREDAFEPQSLPVYLL